MKFPGSRLLIDLFDSWVFPHLCTIFKMYFPEEFYKRGFVIVFGQLKFRFRLTVFFFSLKATSKNNSAQYN